MFDLSEVEDFVTRMKSLRDRNKYLEDVARSAVQIINQKDKEIEALKSKNTERSISRSHLDDPKIKAELESKLRECEAKLKENYKILEENTRQLQEKDQLIQDLKDNLNLARKINKTNQGSLAQKKPLDYGRNVAKVGMW